MDNAAKKRAVAAIDSRTGELIAFGEDILHHPELGYREKRTSAKVTEAFKEIGITEITHPAKTGVKAWLRRADGPRIVINGNATGFIGKSVYFHGKEAHAGGTHGRNGN